MSPRKAVPSSLLDQEKGEKKGREINEKTKTVRLRAGAAFCRKPSVELHLGAKKGKYPTVAAIVMALSIFKKLSGAERI